MDLTDADRAILRSPATMAARRKLAPFMIVAQPQLAAVRPSLPSYVNAAIDAAFAAIDRWQHDEETAHV